MVPARCIRSLRTQRGAALLAMTALAVVVATGLVLNRLTGARDRSHETVEALALAKASLLAYAVAGSTTRPGELPCPDVDYDGLSTAGVDYTAGGDNPCVSLRGWLPHRTLGVESAILDSEDERLWFALADLYHSGHQDPLNSDVPGSLQVDAYTDIVAVVIAPLAPVDDAQDAYRPGESAAHDAVVDVGHYLKHANADATLTTYVSQVSSGDFNDRLIALTRAELMAAVEKRVLGEVAQVLETYRNESWNTATVYPWLAPLGDPSASAFEASVGTSVGYLSYHEPNDAFATSYLMDWDLNSATVNRWGTVKGWQLRDDTVSFSTTEGTCTWATEEQVTCGGVKSFTKKCLGVSGTPVDRTYSFVFTGLTGTVSIVPPASSSHRQRTVDIPWTNPLDPVTTTLSFTMQDVATSGPKLGQVCGSGTLVNDGNTRGRILAQSLRYDLGVPNELPSWVLDQQWHHLLYAAVSDAEMPGGSGNCPGVDCLTLTGVSPDNDKAALLVAAGGALASQNRSVWSIGAYFEAENKITNNGIFAKARLSQTFNDQIRVVSP